MSDEAALAPEADYGLSVPADSQEVWIAPLAATLLDNL